MTARTVTAPETAPVVKKTTRVAKPKATALFGFTVTPTGPLLRAYFLALAMAQTGGKLLANRKFKLWPGANLHGHVAAERMVAHKHSTFALTTAGVEYFNASRPPSKNLLDQMQRAVVTGKPPKDCYNVAMTPLS